MRRVFLVFSLVVFCWGCVSTGALNPVSPVVSLINPDAKLFREACSIIIEGGGKTEDYVKAREMFSVLVKEHPDSRWTPYARLFVKILNELERMEQSKNTALQRVSTCQTDLEKLRRSLEHMAREVERLEKENRQLKDDMEALKKLEIELQKKGRLGR